MDAKNANTWTKPEVVPPTPENTVPQSAANKPVRMGDQVAATREQLRASGLNAAALTAIEAANAGIDKQRK
jgi:hypothetical protein